MPKFFIEYGYEQLSNTDVIEADSQEEAGELAWEMMCERAFSRAEPYDPDEHDGTF